MTIPPKKILYLSPNGYLGGAERFILDAALGHKKFGNLQASIFFLNDGEAVKEASAKKIPNIVLPFKMRLSRPISLIKTILYLRKYIARERIDILNEAMPYSHIVGFFATLGTNVKNVWYQHGPVGGLLDKIAVMLKSDLILFNSHYLKDQHQKIRSFFHYKNNRAVCSPGVMIKKVSDSDCQNIIEQYHLSGKIIWVHAARICYLKGQQQIIEALNLLKKNRPEIINNVVLLILGKANNDEDKKYYQQLSNLVEKYNLTGQVKFLGHQNEVQTFFKLADVVFHTSIVSESFGLSVAEAMGQGALVIGSNQGGVTELLQDQKTGLTYNPCDKLWLNTLCEKIINFKGLSAVNLSEIKTKAQQKIIDQYSLASLISNLENYYQKIS